MRLTHFMRKQPRFLFHGFEGLVIARQLQGAVAFEMRRINYTGMKIRVAQSQTNRRRKYPVTVKRRKGDDE